MPHWRHHHHDRVTYYKCFVLSWAVSGVCASDNWCMHTCSFVTPWFNHWNREYDLSTFNALRNNNGQSRDICSAVTLIASGTNVHIENLTHWPLRCLNEILGKWFIFNLSNLIDWWLWYFFALRWMSLNLTDNQLTLVQEMTSRVSVGPDLFRHMRSLGSNELMTLEIHVQWGATNIYTLEVTSNERQCISNHWQSDGVLISLPMLNHQSSAIFAGDYCKHGPEVIKRSELEEYDIEIKL